PCASPGGGHADAEQQTLTASCHRVPRARPSEDWDRDYRDKDRGRPRSRSSSMNPDVRETLHSRLRRPPARFSVPGSLPVLFFADVSTAGLATIGINPSDQESLSPSGSELDGALRRFETLKSLAAVDRASLSSEQCDRAVETMRGYFRPGK